MDSKEELQKFKEWVENTQFFKVIKENSGNYNCELESPDFTFRLTGGIKVERFEDLPKELIQQFYKNSPWYKTVNGDLLLINELKLLSNGN